MGIFGPRDTIGDTAVYELAPYPADAIAISKVVEVVRVPAAEILAALPTDPAIGLMAHRTLLLHHRVLRAKLAVLTAGSVAARIATLLCHLSDRFGESSSPPSRSRVRMDLSRAVIASFVQARVETVIRTLSAWRRQGIVDLSDDGFEIDRKAMQAIASGT